ncbi:hypothetical protein B0H15DRAFT_425795 [Mycena belliarum]|uniref:Uncharacterized protein n=1 Tax=Mycena belliarum TaxID=1033014 RepID=A0AAD6TZ94_9AGAR|nr:hypothetical protein B0H15DRAFT_425795 [Mycena belliae]
MNTLVRTYRCVCTSRWHAVSRLREIRNQHSGISRLGIGIVAQPPRLSFRRVANSLFPLPPRPCFIFHWLLTLLSVCYRGGFAPAPRLSVPPRGPLRALRAGTPLPARAVSRAARQSTTSEARAQNVVASVSKRLPPKAGARLFPTLRNRLLVVTAFLSCVSEQLTQSLPYPQPNLVLAGFSTHDWPLVLFGMNTLVRNLRCVCGGCFK